MIPTLEQHAALLREILAEMTPEQLAEALKPIAFDPEAEMHQACADLCAELDALPKRLAPERFYTAFIVNPYLTV